MVDQGRERFLPGVGALAGVFGGVVIYRAGFAAGMLWAILILLIPTVLALAGARRSLTFVVAAVSLMTSAYIPHVAFNIRSQYYAAYGVRADDIVVCVVGWGGAVAAGIAIAWIARMLTARGMSMRHRHDS